MFFKPSLILAVAASVAASPVKRQQSSPVASPAQTTALLTTTLASITDTASISSLVSSAASSISSAVSSVASSAASNTTTAPAPTGTAQTSSNQTLPYGCPTGYSLTYVLGTNTYPAINITTAYNALFNWNLALPPPIMLVNQTGSGPGVAQRTWSLNNLTVSELLTNQTTNQSTGYLEEIWVTTAAVNVTPSLIISNATSDLTVFQNGTTPNNVTTVQLYVNFCASAQDAGLTFYSQIVSSYLTGLNALFLNATNPTAASNTTAGVASTAASSASGVSSSISSGVAGATSTVASGVTGAVTTAISGASSVLSTAVGGATSVASAGVSGATSIVSAGVGGASSIGSVVAGPFTA
ncbi:hypothetical protein EMMF5_001103 [Cystobasidiomycetes sp. EMM_F5]